MDRRCSNSKRPVLFVTVQCWFRMSLRGGQSTCLSLRACRCSPTSCPSPCGSVGVTSVQCSESIESKFSTKTTTCDLGKCFPHWLGPCPPFQLDFIRMWRRISFGRFASWLAHVSALSLYSYTYARCSIFSVFHSPINVPNLNRNT